MKQPHLDHVLVPLGIAIMAAYHIWIFYRVARYPMKTVMGINIINRRIWVNKMMEDTGRNGVLAVQTLRNNIMASTLSASTAIMLCSVLAMLMTGANGGAISAFRHNEIVLGDRSELAYSIKIFSILVCFLVAFLMNVQSVRYYSHASILINVGKSPHLSAEYVARGVNRGSYFYSLGMRAFYFSFPIFLWLFGPIPMFLCCMVLVYLLYSLDVPCDDKMVIGDDEDEEERG